MFVAATVESSETTESLWNHVKKKPGAPHFLFLSFSAFFLSLHHEKTEVVMWKCVYGEFVRGKKKKKWETQIYGLLAMLNYCKVHIHVSAKKKKEMRKEKPDLKLN